MRSRRSSSEHAETVARRLELLGEEFRTAAPAAPAVSTSPDLDTAPAADPVTGPPASSNATSVDAGPVDAGPVGAASSGVADDGHTHLRVVPPFASGHQPAPPPEGRSLPGPQPRGPMVGGQMFDARAAGEPGRQGPDPDVDPTAVRPARPGPEETRVPSAPELPVPGRHADRHRARVDLAAFRGHVGLGPAHVAVVAVVVAVGMALTAWWVLRDDPGELAAPTTAAPLVTPSGPSPTAAASSATEVVVDVAGKVRRPGIVVLEPGARVVDAVQAAGGPRRGVKLTGLNLARPLVDGEQIVVGIKPPPGVAASAAPAPGAAPEALVNLNTATLADLEALSGVGPVTAQAIIDWRTENGGFRSVEQLLEVDGIGEKTLADLAPHVTLG